MVHAEIRAPHRVAHAVSVVASDDRTPRRPVATGRRSRGTLVVAIGVLAAAAVLTVALYDSTLHSQIMRLYAEPARLRDMLNRLGVFAPIAFFVLQALQVVVAPIPGDVTGLLGGFVFGVTRGFLYSTVGLTAGSLAAFWLARRLGALFVRRLVSERVWQRVGFVVEGKGAIVCFIIFLIPGLPKDTACYLFGLSPMPLWVFALTSTLGRMPGTWMLSAQGAEVATGDYWHVLLLSVAIAAIAVPLYCYRAPILAAVRRRRAGGADRQPGRSDDDSLGMAPERHGPLTT